jgi:microcystin degradation protein MlrC
VLAGIVDAAAFNACARAGVGRSVTVEMGGKLDVEHGAPLRVTGVVEHLHCSPETSAEPGIATLPDMPDMAWRPLISNVAGYAD